MPQKTPQGLQVAHVVCDYAERTWRGGRHRGGGHLKTATWLLPRCLEGVNTSGFCPQLLLRPAQPRTCLPDVVPRVVPRVALRDPVEGLPGCRQGALADPRRGVHRRRRYLGHALHRDARLHDSRGADPLQRADHHWVVADLGRRGDRRVVYRRLRQRRVGPADRRRHRHRYRRGRDALHGHGGHVHAGLHVLPASAGGAVGSDRDRGRHRGAVDRHLGQQHRGDRWRGDRHGHRGHRDALHRDGGVAGEGRPHAVDGHRRGGHCRWRVRCDRRDVPDPAAARDQPGHVSC